MRELKREELQMITVYYCKVPYTTGYGAAWVCVCVQIRKVCYCKEPYAAGYGATWVYVFCIGI